MTMRFILPVQHREQKFDWDCGITCLRMLIDYYHLDTSAFERLLESYDCNKSTWTIDLLHLLHRAGIDASLHTITIGCSSSYVDVPYYESLIDRDRERVTRLFRQEANHVKLGSLSWTDLKKHLMQYRTPCLVLIDANQLECCTCAKSIFERFIDRFVPAFSSTYQGHYILVIGFIAENNEEFIRYVDPGKTDGFCTARQANFDQARQAFGTDEDIICCYERLADTELQ
jgi:hypothetical protein